MLGSISFIVVAFLACVTSSSSLRTNHDVWALKLLDLDKYPLAQCLDGSPGGFWFSPGFDSGAHKYLIHFQGGGWCVDYEDCYYRSQGNIGSSKTWELNPDCNHGSTAAPCTADAGNFGLIGRDSALNPDFYNWNQIFVGYCDGASFSGTVQDPVPVTVRRRVNQDSFVHYKGKFILDALVDSLLSDLNTPNLLGSKEIIISGTSAGGLTVYLHVDEISRKIRKAVPIAPRIVAIPDAGYFMDIPSISGQYLYTPHYQNVFKMQQVESAVDKNCVSHYSRTNDTWRCFFAPYTLPFVSTPTFIVNSLVDSWQGSNIMGLQCGPSDPNCSLNQEQVDYLNYFRDQMLHNTSLAQFLSKPEAGAWLIECYGHCLLDNNDYYVYAPVQETNMVTAITNWYFKKMDTVHIAVDGDLSTHHC